MALLEKESAPGTAEGNSLAKSNDLIPPPLADHVQSPSIESMDASINNSPSLFGELPNGERHLFNHFLHVVSRALVVVDDDLNPFLQHLIPMAFVHDSIRHAIAALSASHLAKVYPVFQLDSLKHHSQALWGLKALIGVEGNADCVLATTLILCLLEVFVSSYFFINYHLAFLLDLPRHVQKMALASRGSSCDSKKYGAASIERLYVLFTPTLPLHRLYSKHYSRYSATVASSVARTNQSK